MTGTAKPAANEGVPRLGGGRGLRVCGAVVAALLVGSIIYGIVMAVANYAQVAV